MAAARKVIITCAVTGSGHTPTMSPHLPYTVEDIVAQSVAAAQAGAAVIHLHARDNVAVARVPLSPGQTLRIEGVEFQAKSNIPAGHKLALMRIEPGEHIYRYGQRIGLASRPIEQGEHVHMHNVTFEEIEFAYEFPTKDVPFPAPPKNMSTFMGYQREIHMDAH